MAEFTQDWFSHNILGLTEMMKLLPERKRILEIGSFEGRSSIWFHNQLIENTDSKIMCLDTWKGSEEHAGIDFMAVYKRFLKNIADLPMLNWAGLDVSSHFAIQWNDEDYYNFIYIDGSHQAPDVLIDAIFAWKMLEVGGIMVFDDYAWGNELPVLHRPKPAIDVFMMIFAEKLTLLMIGNQLAIRKLRD
jgi:predicted O-methyltransferase YrrM